MVENHFQAIELGDVICEKISVVNGISFNSGFDNCMILQKPIMVLRIIHQRKLHSQHNRYQPEIAQ